jgi:hypothetical protein
MSTGFSAAGEPPPVRPDEIVELEALVDEAATRLANLIVRDQPWLDYARVRHVAFVELSLAVTDIGHLAHRV